MELPLLLAGPVLRRVQPTLVSVWLALSRPAKVRLSVWKGPARAGSGTPWVEADAPGTATVRVGAQLHIVVATLKIAAGSDRVLVPGQLYAYDVKITAGNDSATLDSLQLLKSGTASGVPVEALGHEDGQLPGFALPPADLSKLRIVFGSCRLPNNDHPDAMVWIDDLMRDNADYRFDDADKRPHQLVLGGDQIYADDVSPLHLQRLNLLGQKLIGEVGATPVEHLPVRTEPPPASSKLLPADLMHFPAARRFLLTTVEAQMTTVDGFSHLFAFGEFAAMYLSVWSPVPWSVALALPAGDPVLPKPEWPPGLPYYIDAPLGVKTDPRAGPGAAAAFMDYPRYGGSDPAARLAAQPERLARFQAGLAKVRRVLANVPTYMIFDDHDVTDDWNLNPLWIQRVMTTDLGVTTLRNALAAYALFQDWGNDPLRYEDPAHDKHRLLDALQGLFPAGVAEGPVAEAAQRAEQLFFGPRPLPEVDVDGRYEATPPPLAWHFSMPGTSHRSVVLDNRTRRSFASRQGPPGNVAISAQADQVPAAPLPAAEQVLLVVAPLQVIGPPLLDELLAPASFRATDMVAYTFQDKAGSTRRDGRRGMTGTDPDAIEGWGFDSPTFEALLARLAAHQRVVLLSGDVHYSASQALSYWSGSTAAPARLAQFTSSGMKNVMPAMIVAASRSLGIAQQLLRQRIGAERLGWTTRPTDPVKLAAGQTGADIPRALRARLRAEPTLLPTHGWPEGAQLDPAKPPDWQWRIDPVLDLRPDAERPASGWPTGTQVPVLDKPALNAALAAADPARTLQAYQALAAHQQGALTTLRNTRQVLFRSNFGVLRFEGSGDTLHAVHEIYTAFPPSPTGTARPLRYVLHRVALSAPATARPQDALKPPAADVPA